MATLRVSLNTLRYKNLKETQEININGEIIIYDIDDFQNQSIVFKEKTFVCEKIIFEKLNKLDINIHFENCIFDCDIEFDNCTFDRLCFTSCEIKSNKFAILNSNINSLEFKKNTNDVKNIKKTSIKNGTIQLKNGIIKRIDIDNMHFDEGKLEIKNLNYIESCSIINSTLHHVVISHCNFENYFDYSRNKTTSRLDSSFFNHCTFNDSSFFETTFNSSTHFSNCFFLKETKFENLNSEIYSKIKFTNSEFLKHTTFNYSLIHQLSFEKTKFIDEISIQETYFDIIKIEKTIFEKGALFDDIQIKKIDICDRRTIRVIKQELQKKENNIDYNKFRVHEFNAYIKDLRKKIIAFDNDKKHFRHRIREKKELKRDLFILTISNFFSVYGTDWKRALKVTLVIGFFTFTPFFILENFEKSISLSNYTDFIYSYFRFFLITDFKNEYYEAGETILKFNNLLSLPIFILGKIAIAFGIYEMIQSFRKFKA